MLDCLYPPFGGRSPQEGHDLRPGTGFSRAEGGGTGAAGDPLFHRPRNGFVILLISGICRIGKGQRRFALRSACRAPDKIHRCHAVAGEIRIQRPLYKTQTMGPMGGHIVVITLFYIGKPMGDLHLGAACRPPQEGENLPDIACIMGRKGDVAGTRCNLLLQRPQHGLLAEAALGDVHEGMLRDGGLGLACGCPQEGHRLGAIAGSGGREGGVRDES